MVIETINELDERGINIKSLTEPDIDTTTPMGRALFGIVAVFSQLGVDTIRENTLRGLEHARAQGTCWRPSKRDDSRARARCCADAQERGEPCAHCQGSRSRYVFGGAGSGAR